jgi:hypothetical protein
MEPTYTQAGINFGHNGQCVTLSKDIDRTSHFKLEKTRFSLRAYLKKGVEEEGTATRPRSDDRNKCCAMRPAGAALRFYNR